MDETPCVLPLNDHGWKNGKNEIEGWIRIVAFIELYKGNEIVVADESLTEFQTGYPSATVRSQGKHDEMLRTQHYFTLRVFHWAPNNVRQSLLNSSNYPSMITICYLIITHRLNEREPSAQSSTGLRCRKHRSCKYGQNNLRNDQKQLLTHEFSSWRDERSGVGSKEKDDVLSVRSAL